ncbi:MAG: hypothetical protein ACTHOF_07600 [Flavisolibacter sp.]
MTRLFLISFLISEFYFLGCTPPASERHSKYLGQVAFRQSYAGHENWSGAEIDSAESSNPYYLDAHGNSGQKIVDILAALKIASTDQLFLDKIGHNLKDTVVFSAYNNGNDTAFIKYDASKTLRASIILRNKKLLDSVPIERGTLPDVFHLIDLKGKSNRFIVLLDQYYISNGNNYEISVYERK